jgi:hypothetical protein
MVPAAAGRNRLTLPAKSVVPGSQRRVPDPACPGGPCGPLTPGAPCAPCAPVGPAGPTGPSHARSSAAMIGTKILQFIARVVEEINYNNHVEFARNM